MSILPILLYPNPLLKTKSLAVDRENQHLDAVIDDLLGTMRAHQFCVGLAAPQVGVISRVVVIDGSRARKSNKNHGELVLLNPIITTTEGKQLFREGCLSIPSLTGNVTRHTSIVVESLDRDGIPQKIIAEGFEAVILQHEIDHLDGILFLDRVTSLKTDVFRRKNY